VALPSRGAALEIIFERALRLGGLTPDDVEFKILTYPDMLPALANRSVDVAMELEPFITQGRARQMLVPWKSGADLYPGEQTAAVFYGPSIVEMSGGVGNRLMLAYTRALRDFNDAFGAKQQDRAAIIAILTKYTNVKDPALHEQMAKEYLNPDCYVNSDAIAADLQWYVANGYVAQAPDLAQAIDPRYCDYAVGELGRYQP
jgi:NitT/TauT family transport system substrate-binding protein